MTSHRPTIARMMLIVVFAAVPLLIYRHRSDPLLLVWALGAAILSPYVLWPIRLHRTNRIFLDGVVEPIDLEGSGVPLDVAEAARRAVDGLEPLGFRFHSAYRHVGAVPKATGYAIPFGHDCGDIAKILINMIDGNARAVSSLLLYSAEFMDGTEVLTSNSRVASIYPVPRPPWHALTIPQARGPGELHAIHREQVRRHAADKFRVDPLRGGPVEHQRRMTRKNQDRQIANGYYVLDGSGRFLRPTWKGATLMAWRLLWPVKHLLREWRYRKGDRLIRSLGKRPGPEPSPMGDG